jgi:catechol 2,3-dioxygenase-like lactoylglutathione lyase family enzyme
MLDHVTIAVSDLDRAKAFYDLALKPLGIERLYAEGENFCGYGARAKAFFWVGVRDSVAGGVHIAFAAPDRQAVDEFYLAAIAAGGHDNGPPALRPRYHPHYYAAFVCDPDGHNIEAVCHLQVNDVGC